MRGVEVREKIAERVKKSCEASAWQRSIRLGETLATLGETLALVGKALALVGKGERGVGGLNPGVHLQEVARHCWETLGGLRMEGLLWVGCLGVEGLGNSSLGMGVKGKRCLLRVGCRLVGSLGGEGGWEAGKVVEGWAGEPGEGPRRRSRR